MKREFLLKKRRALLASYSLYCTIYIYSSIWWIICISKYLRFELELGKIQEWVRERERMTKKKSKRIHKFFFFSLYEAHDKFSLLSKLEFNLLDRIERTCERFNQAHAPWLCFLSAIIDVIAKFVLFTFILYSISFSKQLAHANIILI
jgi:hypothetical protein